MQYYSDEPGKLYIDFCAFISNIQNVDSKTGLQMIESLQQNLTYKRNCINDQLELKDEVSFYVTAVIDLYLQIYTVFCNWIEDFKKQYIDYSETK